MGVVDVSADREILMLYSSFLGKLGAGALWSYARDAQAAGIGSTGGGVETGPALPTLGWDEHGTCGWRGAGRATCLCSAWRAA